MTQELLTIGEAAASLGRLPQTLRKWERMGLPAHLFPERNDRGERRYSPELVEHIREWAIAENMRPGKNLIEIHQQRSAAA